MYKMAVALIASTLFLVSSSYAIASYHCTNMNFSSEDMFVQPVSNNSNAQ